MGSDQPKQFLEHRGKSMLQWSIEACLALDQQLKALVLPLPSSFFSSPPPWLNSLDPRIHLCLGGNSRQSSVHKGFELLKQLGHERGIWLVHDAARPNLLSSDLERLLDKIASTGQGALLANPVRDTIKRERDGLVDNTVDRKQLWAAQTPQGAPASMMWNASLKAMSENWSVTDDASLLEQNKVPVHLVEGDPCNFKVTSPSDWEHFCRLN